MCSQCIVCEVLADLDSVYITFTRFCACISIALDKISKCFGKLAAVCCIHIMYPKPLSQKRRFGSLFMESSRSATQGALQWSKHCGSWHSYISCYQTHDSWPISQSFHYFCTIFQSMLEKCEKQFRKWKFSKLKSMLVSPPTDFNFPFYGFPSCFSDWSET